MLEADVGLRLGSFELDVAVRVPTGSTVAVLGPNGAGKTTLLRALAGLVPLRRGRIVVGDAVLDEPATATFVPPEHRSVGYVFQDHLLFPHLSVVDNVAFGLRARGATKAAARNQALAHLERLGLGALSDRRPRSLSGGQAQRVALVRALATTPRLLLLDEPLAALDADAKVALRRELGKDLAGFGGAGVLVTHDVVDAFALASHLVVVEGGRVTQHGETATVAARPRTAFVAALMGVNLLSGVAEGDHRVLVGPDHFPLAVADRAHGPVLVTVSPADVALHRSRPTSFPGTTWTARVEAIEATRDRARMTLAGPLPLVAEVSTAVVAELGPDVGGELWASVRAGDVAVDRA